MGTLATLSAYTPEYDEVQLPKVGALRVRGVSLDDMELLLRAHLDTVEMIFSLVKTSRSGPAAGEASARFVLALAQEAPAFAAQVIALAADEPDQAAAVRKLPFPVVVDALTKIGRLTFEEAGGVEGFGNALAALIGGLRKPTSAKAAA